MNIEKYNQLRTQGLSVGITFSQWDLLHPGHIAMLAEAKQHCDYLICGLQNDSSVERKNKNSPVQTLVERQISLGAVKFVDEIIVYNTEKDLEDILLLVPIDVRILGIEYKGKDFTGKEICETNNIKIVYNSRKHSLSSSELRRRILLSENK